MAIVGVILGVCLTAVQIVAGPIISSSQASQLRIGMSQAEVASILGSLKYCDGVCWTYERHFNPGWAQVYFDRDGRLVRIYEELAFGSRHLVLAPSLNPDS